jgi:hypothetical protein
MLTYSSNSISDYVNNDEEDDDNLNKNNNNINNNNNKDNSRLNLKLKNTDVVKKTDVHNSGNVDMLTPVVYLSI